MRWWHVRVWLNLAKAFACTFSPMCWRISTYCRQNSKLVSKTIILRNKPTYFAQTPLLDSSCAVVYQPRSAHGTANDTIHQPTVWKRWCLGTGPSGWSWWDTWRTGWSWWDTIRMKLMGSSGRSWRTWLLGDRTVHERIRNTYPMMRYPWVLVRSIIAHFCGPECWAYKTMKKST